MANRCAACAAHRETVAALKEALRAKDQTITVLADQIDQARGTEAKPAPAPLRLIRGEDSEQRMWISDEEEEIVAAMAEGVLPPEDGERRLAALQAMSTHVVVE